MLMHYVEKSQLLEIWVYRICRKVRVKTLEIGIFVLGAIFSERKRKRQVRVSVYNKLTKPIF